MRLYRPVAQTVVAVQWDGTNEDEVCELLRFVHDVKGITVMTYPPVGHWLVSRNGGGVTTLSPEKFTSQYEPLFNP